MAAIAASIDPVPAPSLSLVPPPAPADQQLVRPRFRRLVVFTGKIA
jgi:hypothetical protein